MKQGNKMLGMNRRTALKGMAGAGALAMAPGVLTSTSAWAADMMQARYLTPFGYLIGFAPSMYAQSGGLFKKQGLDVEIQGGRGSAMAVQQVTAGNVLVSRTGGTDLIKAVATSPAVIAIAEIYQRDIFFVISDKEKPIKTPADMAGKTIGVVSKGGATENILDMMLAKEGVPADEVRREVVGNAPAAFEFINQGRIDAYIATNDTVFQLGVDNKPIEAWSTDEVAPAPGQVYIAKREDLEKNAEALARFLRGVHDSLGAMIAAKDLVPVVDSMNAQYEIFERKRPDKGLSVLRNGLNNYKPAYNDKLASDPNGWNVAYNLMVQANIIEEMDSPVFYTDTVRQRAFG